MLDRSKTLLVKHPTMRLVQSNCSFDPAARLVTFTIGPFVILSDCSDTNRVQGIWKYIFQSWKGEVGVFSAVTFCFSPNPLNRVKLAMELGEKQACMALPSQERV